MPSILKVENHRKILDKLKVADSNAGILERRILEDYGCSQVTTDLKECSLFFFKCLILFQACQVAGALKLHSRFSPEDFLLPLCVQDKLTVVEEFVENDKNALNDFLKYLDALLIGDTFTSVCDIVG